MADDQLGLTEMLGNVLNKYGRLHSLKLFRLEPLAAYRVTLSYSESDGVCVYPEGEGTGSAGFCIPTFQERRWIRASEASVENIRNQRLQTIRREISHLFYRHLERMMMDCLKGLVRNQDNDTVIDLFKAFRITMKTFDLPVSLLDQYVNAPASDVSGLTDSFREIRNYAEDNTFGPSETPIVLCSGLFWDKLEKSEYLSSRDHNNPVNHNSENEFIRSSISKDGLMFFRLDATYQEQNNEMKNFVEDNFAYVIPNNPDLFGAYYAVANTFKPPPIQITYEFVHCNHRGCEVVMEMNPLLICKRPEALARIKLVNDK